jgi:RNA-binding protein Musashi
MATKLFLGGLTHNTTAEMVEEYFKKYGEVDDATVMYKGDKSRGFGFVTFSTVQAAEEANKDAPHRIDSRVIDVKFAVPKEQIQVNKVFVGGLSHSTNATDLREYFSQYGRVVDAVVLVDKRTNRSRGFGFVRFLSGTSVELVVKNRPGHEIRGKWVDVKRAVPESEIGVGERGEDGSLDGADNATVGRRRGADPSGGLDMGTAAPDMLLYNQIMQAQSEVLYAQYVHRLRTAELTQRLAQMQLLNRELPFHPVDRPLTTLPFGMDLLGENLLHGQQMTDFGNPLQSRTLNDNFLGQIGMSKFLSLDGVQGQMGGDTMQPTLTNFDWDAFRSLVSGENTSVLEPPVDQPR